MSNNTIHLNEINKLNDNFLYFVFNSTVFSHNMYPRSKIFLKLTEIYLEKYKYLINKIEADLKLSISDEDTVFYGKSNYLTPRIVGGTVDFEDNDKPLFYKYINYKTDMI